MPRRLALPAEPGTVTWEDAGLLGVRDQSWAADAWLSAASGPQARTAAIQVPSRESLRWPTA